jgi:hypothetical protein
LLLESSIVAKKYLFEKYTFNQCHICQLVSKKGRPVHVAPACAGSGEGPDSKYAKYTSIDLLQVVSCRIAIAIFHLSTTSHWVVLLIINPIQLD